MSSVSWIDSVFLEGGAATGGECEQLVWYDRVQLSDGSLACEEFPEPQSGIIEGALSTKVAVPIMILMRLLIGGSFRWVCS